MNEFRALKDEVAGLRGQITGMEERMAAVVATQQGHDVRVGVLETTIALLDERMRSMERASCATKFRAHSVPFPEPITGPATGDQVTTAVREVLRGVGVSNEVQVIDAVAFPPSVGSSSDSGKATIVFEVQSVAQAKVIWNAKHLLRSQQGVSVVQNLTPALREEKQALLAQQSFKDAVNAQMVLKERRRGGKIRWDGERCWLGVGRNAELWTLARARAENAGRTAA